MRYIIIQILLLVCSHSIYAQSGSIALGVDYSEREVMIHTSTGNLYGTLVIPIDNELRIVALIIPGFGLTDRDGNNPQTGQNNSLKMLAEDLAGKRISTLRIDKREVTEGKKSVMIKSEVRIEDMVEDAVSWLRFLKADKRFSKVAVIGHSEGALVGMLASEIADIKYYVSIAGFGKPGYEVLEERLAGQLTQEQMDTARIYIAELKKGKLIKTASPLFADIFSSGIQPYLTSWFKYDPVAEIANLNANVLLVQGARDLQVGSGELIMLASAYPMAKELLIDDMNHVLKMVKGGKEENQKTYKNPDFPLAEGLVEGIVHFFKD